MPNITKNIKDLDTIIRDPETSGSFGPVDQYTGKIGGMLGTDEGKTVTKINTLSSNLLAGFGKAQMAGVLTNQDMDIIKQQIPSSGDTHVEAQTKIEFIKNFMAEKNQAWYRRMEESNPGFAFGTVTADTPVPLGFAKYKNADGSYTIEPK